MIGFLPTEKALIPMMILFLLVSGRLTALFIASPIFSSGTFPARIKGAIVAVVTFAIFLGIPMPSTLPTELDELIFAMAGEIAVGAAAGLTAQLVMAAVDGAGRLLGLPMGLSFANAVDPMTKVSTVVTSRILGIIVSMAFLVMDVHLVLIKLIAQSFISLPPGAAYMSATVGLRLAEHATIIFTGTMQLAAPVLLTLLGVMLVMAMMAKIAPKINVMVLSFAVSIGLGLLSLKAALPDMVTWMGDAVNRIHPLAVDTLEHF